MFDQSPNGQHSWRMPSPGEILLRIESRLGGLETGQAMTLDAVKEGSRKMDHAHARITDLKGRVERLEQSASTTQPSGQPPMGTAGLLSGLTSLLTALAAVLPPLGTLAVLIIWLVAALTAGLNAETVRGLIGLTP
ncbi:hypothetical protein [Hyphomicrobium sp. CS1GBMeth3]|uniref:hypothetical protein n=1 Tax=Hyphomicrobium sp. CS1GBMeth3 TaxID=1892845 RepID=UPI00093112A5|nr:hypothetical protein [Hyphomicrobium sp. CS1GBMeth3]